MELCVRLKHAPLHELDTEDMDAQFAHFCMECKGLRDCSSLNMGIMVISMDGAM